MDTRIPTYVAPLSQGPDNSLMGLAPNRTLTEISRAELHAFEITHPKGRVLICAGGGYLQLMYDREGVDVAIWLNGLGYDAYVLIHRLPGPWPKDIALIDAISALDIIKRDLPIFLMGLSSGGHLAGALACQPDVNISGLLIAYAPINANHIDYKAPAFKPDYPPVEKQDFYNDWPIGIAKESHAIPNCPVFLAYALHDAIVPIEHALNFIQTARDLELDLDAHIFSKAPHGFALSEKDGSHAAWPDLAAQWLDIKGGM